MSTAVVNLGAGSPTVVNLGAGSPTVVEVGPETVRTLRGRSAGTPDDAMVAAALDCIDDVVALLDDRPVAAADLWRTLMSSTLGKCRGSVVVLHPSWWSRSRVGRVTEATAATARDVAALSRSELILRAHPAGTVIEIAAELVAVCRGAAMRTLGHADIGSIADAAVELAESGEVLLDTAPGVAGSAQISTEIRDALSRRGLSVRDVNIEDLAAATHTEDGVTPGPRFPRPARALLAVSVAVLVLGAVIVVGGPPRGSAPVPATRTASLVEGRIAVQIPPSWIVERVTGGPGSRRVQVSSPADGVIALHITQSYAPETTLAAAAEVLGRAIADQPPGVFVDFRPADHMAGRPAVTYREVRAGRVIRWSVVLAGSTRISIGCQSAPGREDGIRGPCEQAVRSAREVGTVPPG